MTEELQRKEENGYIVDFYDNYLGDQSVASAVNHQKKLLMQNQGLKLANHQSLIRKLQHRKKKHTYELYGMIVHHGFSSRRGHYYALIRHPTGGWLKFDDEKITLIENPEKFFRDSQKAYILFYQKKWIFDETSAKTTPEKQQDKPA